MYIPWPFDDSSSVQGMNSAEVGPDRMLADKKADCRFGKDSISRFFRYLHRPKLRPGAGGMVEEIIALWSKTAGRQTELQTAITASSTLDGKTA